MAVQHPGPVAVSAPAAHQIVHAPRARATRAHAPHPTRPATSTRLRPHASAPITASVNAAVPCVPPMSRVRAEPSPITEDTALLARAATSP